MDIPREIIPTGAKCYAFHLFEDNEVVGSLLVGVHLGNRYKLNVTVRALNELAAKM